MSKVAEEVVKSVDGVYGVVERVEWSIMEREIPNSG